MPERTPPPFRARAAEDAFLVKPARRLDCPGTRRRRQDIAKTPTGREAAEVNCCANRHVAVARRGRATVSLACGLGYRRGHRQHRPLPSSVRGSLERCGSRWRKPPDTNAGVEVDEGHVARFGPSRHEFHDRVHAAPISRSMLPPVSMSRCADGRRRRECLRKEVPPGRPSLPSNLGPR